MAFSRHGPADVGLAGSATAWIVPPPHRRIRPGQVFVARYHGAMTARHFRWAWWLLAYLSLGVGIVGIFVPGLPTTVFVLISAWAASRGSERLHRWLLAHRLFGPMIRDWHAYRAVSRRAKRAAVATMAVCAAILWWVTPSPWGAAAGTACMAVVAAWLWRRPEPPIRPGEDGAG